MVLNPAIEPGRPIPAPTTLNTVPTDPSQIRQQTDDEVEEQLHQQVLKTIRETFGEE